MPKKWFVLRAQNGKEDQVRERLEWKIRAEGLEELISRVLVPTETVSEIRSGTARTRKRKIYPGYVVAEIEVDDDGKIPQEVVLVMKDTAGVGDFLGSGDTPVPMTSEEVQRILNEVDHAPETPKLHIQYAVGDLVKIKEGSFENFEGTVEEVIPARGRVRVIVPVFGRPTPIDLEYWKVEPV